MAARNAVNVSSIPFEQRSLPPDRRRRTRERLTVTDRLVCAVCGILLGFALWTFGYLILVSGTMKAAVIQVPATKGQVELFEKLPPFWWGGPVALGFGLFGAAVGAERMMDGFERVIGVEGAVARAVNRS
jgi:hypothetical protein